MMSGVGSMHLFELFRIQPAESGMRIICTLVTVKTLYAGNKLLYLFCVIHVAFRLKRRHGTNPTRRVAAQCTRHQSSSHDRAKKREQRHPSRVAFDRRILHQSQVTADLPERPVPMSSVAGSEQSLGFVDGVVQIRKLQEAQIAHEIVDCIGVKTSQLRGGSIVDSLREIRRDKLSRTVADTHVRLAAHLQKRPDAYHWCWITREAFLKRKAARGFRTICFRSPYLLQLPRE